MWLMKQLQLDTHCISFKLQSKTKFYTRQNCWPFVTLLDLLQCFATITCWCVLCTCLLSILLGGTSNCSGGCFVIFLLILSRIFRMSLEIDLYQQASGILEVFTTDIYHHHYWHLFLHSQLTKTRLTKIHNSLLLGNDASTYYFNYKLQAHDSWHWIQLPFIFPQ